MWRALVGRVGRGRVVLVGVARVHHRDLVDEVLADPGLDLAPRIAVRALAAGLEEKLLAPDQGLDEVGAAVAGSSGETSVAPM